MSPRVSTSSAGERTVYHLHDDATGASASILPSYGFNLFDLRLPLAGSVRPVVVSEPGWADAPSKPARNGFPILFPFPGRIGHARYRFAGKSYELVPNKPPHAIHGFAYEASWDVIEHAATPSGASILGRFQLSKNAPEAVERWAADATLEVRYTLSGATLALDATVTNPSTAPLPWGFGLHSYFALPFDRREDRSGTKVLVPASESWVLDNALPTGERRSVAGTPLDYREGVSMAGLSADDALTGIAYEGNHATCRLIDETLGGEFRILFDRAIREIVVFTPQGTAGVVAVEPYTEMADAFALGEKGIDAGLRILAPGEASAFRIVFESA